MDTFKNEIKRLLVVDAPEHPCDPPFAVLGKRSANGAGPGETWIVRGWQPSMNDYFESVGATLRDVSHLDLEDGFVELLRAGRSGWESDSV